MTVKGFSTGCPDCHTGFGKHDPDCPRLAYEPLNSATAPLIAEVTKAAVHHYTSYSDGEYPDCDHWHFKHHLRECPPYLDALEELIRTVNGEAQTKLGVIRDSVGPVFRVWRGELTPVEGVGIQITRERGTSNVAMPEV